MSKVFRSVIRMSVLHDALAECPGVEIRIRHESLKGIHELLSLESGHPIYRPSSITAQQATKNYKADESNDDSAFDYVAPQILQQACVNLIHAHYQNKCKSISEVFILNWCEDWLVVIEISYGRLSAR